MKKTVKNVLKRSKISKVIKAYKFKILIPAVLVIGGIFGLTRISSLMETAQIYEISSYNPRVQSAIFPGDAYVFVNSGNQIDLNMSSGFTVEAWVKPTNTVFTPQTIISKSNGTDISYALYLESSFDNTAQQYQVKYHFSVAGSDCKSQYIVTKMQTFSPSQSAMVSTWHHVAGVIENNGDFKVYVDGVSTPPGKLSSVCLEQNSPLIIGARANSNGGFSNYLNGQLDDLVVDDYSLHIADFDATLLYPPIGAAHLYDLIYLFDNNLTDYSYNKRDGVAKGNITFVSSTVPLNSPVPSGLVASAKPSPSPYCYTVGRMCTAQVGQVCPSPYTICTSPTPKPSPVVSIKPSPAPICTTTTSCSNRGCMSKKQCNALGGKITARCNKIGTKINCQVCKPTTVCTYPSPSPIPSSAGTPMPTTSSTSMPEPTSVVTPSLWPKN